MSQRRGGREARAIAVAAGAWSRPGLSLLDGARHLAGWTRRQLAIESERRTAFLWLPVAFGLGIALFFLADARPNLVYAGVLSGLCASVAIVLRHSHGRRIALTGLAALFAGFLAAGLRTEQVAAPILRQVTIAAVTGFVETVERRGEGSRLVIAPDSIGTLALSERPARVRVTTRQPVAVNPGDYVRGTMRLLPPPEPARPGGYDFARDAFFRGIGAVGSVTGRLETLAQPRPPALATQFATWIDAARNRLTERIASALGGQPGAVAAALVTGKRGLIDETTNDALRAAGIYHIVSISGLHMVLVAGAIFWAIRALLALSPTVALTWPVKKIAALAAMAGATFYCVFSGGEVATERSLVMTLIMMGAILVDRPALSLRNLAIAALVVLALEPDTLLGPSFQMSFAAVAALIAFGHATFLRPAPADGPAGRVHAMARRLRTTGWALVATTMVATVATAPFGLFHFQAANPFGLIGNALALPFVSVIVMPSAVFGVFLAPLGLDAPVWWMMSQGVAVVLAIAAEIESWNGARTMIPAFGPGALALLSAGLLLAVLLQSGLRLLAVAPIAAGMALAAGTAQPDIFIDREAQGAAIRGPDSRLVLVGRPSDFVAAQWLAADGDERDPADESLKVGRLCDRQGCVVRLPDGRAVSFLTDRGGFDDDCRRAAIVILRGTAPRACNDVLVIDRPLLAARGALAIGAGKASSAGGAPAPFNVEGARDGKGGKPWLRQTAGTTGAEASGRIAPVTPSAPNSVTRRPPRPAPDESDAGDEAAQ